MVAGVGSGSVCIVLVVLRVRVMTVGVDGMVGCRHIGWTRIRAIPCDTASI